MTKILCIDDAASVRALVRAILGEDGTEVITAASGAEGLEMMLAETPDAVLLDIVMPVMDGLDTLQRIAASPELARIPLMMLTSISDTAKVTDTLALGARDYIVKPFEPDALKRRVKRLLESRGRPSLVPAGTGSPFATPPDLRVMKRVLIADDQASVLAGAQELLGERFEVLLARGGEAALEIAVQDLPDLILLDLYMPDMDGVAVRRRLREFPELAGAKVLAMTLGTPEEARYLGEFDGAVTKPLNANDLLEAVGNVLGLPGLYSFVTRGRLTILRLYKSKLWGIAGLDQLHQDTERAIARMLEAAQTWFVLDLEQLDGLEAQQIDAVVGAVRAIARRATDCRLDAKLVVPYRLQERFERFPQEFGIEFMRRLDDAVHSLEREAERRGAKPR